MVTEPLALYSPETFEITTADNRHLPVPSKLCDSLSRLSSERRLSCLRMWAQRSGFIGSETVVAEVVCE